MGTFSFLKEFKKRTHVPGGKKRKKTKYKKNTKGIGHVERIVEKNILKTNFNFKIQNQEFGLVCLSHKNVSTSTNKLLGDSL